MKFTPWCDGEVRGWKTLAHSFRFESKTFFLIWLDLIKMHRVTMKSDSHSFVRRYLLFMRHAYFMKFLVVANATTRETPFVCDDERRTCAASDGNSLTHTTQSVRFFLTTPTPFTSITLSKPVSHVGQL